MMMYEMKPFKKPKKPCTPELYQFQLDPESCHACGTAVSRVARMMAQRLSFTCPGCGARATAQRKKGLQGTRCVSCHAFAHLACLQQIRKLPYDKGWEWACPACGDVIWHGYLNWLDGRPVY